MKKKGKKIVLTLLLSTALVSTNIGSVYAQEGLSLGKQSSDTSSASESNVKGGSSDAAAAGASSDTVIQKSETVDSTHMAEQTGNDAKETTNAVTDGTEGTADSAAGSSAGTTDTVTDDTEKNSDSSTNTGETANTVTNDKEHTEQTDKADGSGNKTDVIDDTAAKDQNTEADGTIKDDMTETSKEETEGTGEDTNNDSVASAEENGEEAAENTFVNKNGENVVPSSLVGVDYNTIADSYDGETNVLKQYALSDTDAANTIMNSYIDENGNLVMVISQGAASNQESEEKAGFDFLGLTAETGNSNSAPAVDGSFSGWDEIPVSYEYNWDNSANCWQWGNWVQDPTTGETVCYKTEEGTYDSNVRHEMQMYSDGENVYLKITYATIYGSHANGDDFNFYVDGEGTKFEVTWADGSPITGTVTDAGTYVVDVRNGDSASSYSIVDGAMAYYHVTENGINNQLELKIPLSAFQAQNGNVNLDSYSMIQFFTPNLMYDRISVAGSPTGAVPFAAVVFLIVPASYVWLKRKGEEEMAFA